MAQTPIEVLTVKNGDNDPAARSRRQMGMFWAGSAFVMLSSLVTRRSIIQRSRSIRPSFFHPSNEQPLVKFNGPMEALDALGVATINVFSYAIMFGGGLFWVFDVSNIKELKERVKMKKIEIEGENAAQAVSPEHADMAASWPAAALVLREEHAKQETKPLGVRPVQEPVTPRPGPVTNLVTREGSWSRSGSTK